MTNTTALDLDRQRTEFEAAVLEIDSNCDLKRWPSGDYMNRAVDGHWRGWQMALARRSLPVDAGGIKTARERQQDAVAAGKFAGFLDSFKDEEIADLRAALAAKGQQEPVTGILHKECVWCDGTGYTRSDEEDPASEDECERCRGSGYTVCDAAPVAQQSEAGAQDAARYRFLREHWVSFSAAPPLSNLHWKGDKLDAKVDAAILEGGAHG